MTGAPVPAPGARTHSFVALTYIGTLLAAGAVGLWVGATRDLAPEPLGSMHLWTQMIVFSLVATLAIGLLGAAAFFWFVLRGSGRPPLLYVAGILGWVWLTVFIGVGLIAYPRSVVSVRSNLNGEVRAYLQAVLQQRESDRQRFAALDMPNLLQADHLTTAEGVAEARRRIAEARSQAAGSVQTGLTMQTQALVRISAINPAAGQRFGEAAERARSGLDATVRLNAQSLDELAACVDLLDRNRDRWTVSGQVLTFESDDLLQEYSTHLGTLRLLGEQSQSINNRMETRQAMIRAAIDAPDPLGAFIQAIDATSAPASSP